MKTAVRETREETGLEIILERIVGLFSGPQFHHIYPNGDRVKNVTTVFLARPAGAVDDMALTGRSGLDQENMAVDWLPPTDLVDHNRDQPFGRLFEQAVQYMEQGYFLC
jgi:8-oxo-dGTP pyrophosphatase MutT (NUDIX family)